MTAHEKMLAELVEKGLIEPETHRVTPAGDEYTRALIAQYPHIKRSRKRDK